MGAIVAIWVVVWVACGVIGVLIGESKGRGGLGLALGLVLGVFGLLIIAVVSPTPEAQARRNRELVIAAQTLDGAQPRRPCPCCAEMIQPAAKICRYCGRDVEPIDDTSETPARPGWYHDPQSRTSTKRYWDGIRWTRLDD